ncbi:transposase InsO family protein [Roseateles terrae]|uniref:Transposase InsO family protein n=1 Tax=Roseateles terrae TaxID=431060 RepID=A0ABR6GTD4_9BURK|nr:transposase InsO family protein [Roseateles terrae]
MSRFFLRLTQTRGIFSLFPDSFGLRGILSNPGWRVSSSMRRNRRFTPGSPSGTAVWFVTPIGDRNTSASAKRRGCQKPASSRPWGTSWTSLAETINALYEAQLIHRRAPWKTKESVEFATLKWASWFNHHRLLVPLGRNPPAEAEANYYRQLANRATFVMA